MENTVTNRQLFLILIVVQISNTSAEVSKIMTQSAGAGSWFSILLATLLFALLAYILSKLNNMFQGKMVFDYSGELIGKAGAYLVSAFIAIYFLAFICIYNIAQSNLLQTNFLPNTPTWATVMSEMIVAGFVSYKGVTNAARLLEIYGVIFIMLSVGVHIIMFLKGDMNHILPLFDPAETERYIAATKSAVYPLLGFEVMLVIPFSAKNGKQANKTVIYALLYVGAFYILNVLSCVMMIGENEILHYNFPLVTAIRQVELPQLKIFQRLDLIYLTVGVISVIACFSFLYLSVVELVCRMMPKIKRLTVVILVGAAAFAADLALRNIPNVSEALRNILTYSGLAVAGAIPIILFTIAKVKRHAHKKAA